jgi:histidinol-phosphate aminotransferase
MGQFREGLEHLASYTIEDGDWAIKLDANESAFNLPPTVKKELAAQLAGLAFNRYPEITQVGLREKIGATLGFATENIAVGNGSSQLLQAACYIFGGGARRIVFPTPSFSMYSIYCKLADAQPVPVKLNEDFILQPEAILQAASEEQAKLIILCNPNNPTGGVMSPEQVEQVIHQAHCPVIVDEAYHEFYGESVLPLVGKYPNLMVMRTFSKAYGLASARVGYGVGAPEVVVALAKVLLPFNLNMLSLAAAETIMANLPQFNAQIAEIIRLRQRLATELAELPEIRVFPSQANFILFRTAKATELVASLYNRKICVRDFSKAPGMENCIRVTVGTAEENAAFLAVVQQVCAKKV